MFLREAYVDNIIIPQFRHLKTIFKPRCSTKMHHVPGLSAASLQSLLAWERLSDRRSTHHNILVYKSLTHKLPSNMCNISITFLAVMNIVPELALKVTLFKSHAKINQMKENLCQGGGFF